jgi:hypothetical protein
MSAEQVVAQDQVAIEHNGVAQDYCGTAVSTPQRIDRAASCRDRVRVAALWSRR